MKTEFGGNGLAELPEGQNAPGSAGQGKSLRQLVLEFEHEIISEALAEVGGGVTRAAKNLGLSHQALCYIINSRHRDLLAVRSRVRIRRDSMITKRKPRSRHK